jgi:cell division protein FtsB
MDTDQLGMQLHDRSTRGEPLTSEEIRQLETWYAQQDAIEQERLIPQATATADLETLHSQIDASLNQLTAVTQRIQQIAAENAALRQENTTLRQQLTLPRSA